MKNKLYLFLVLSCFFTSSLLAQTKYGDGSLQLESDVTLDWNSVQNNFTPRDSNIYEFDALGRMIRRHQLIYDQTNKQWVSELIRIEQYDSRGNKINHTDSFTNPSKLNKRYKEIIQFNNLNQENFRIHSRWNLGSSFWEPIYRETTTYNSSDQVESVLGERYNPTKLVWFNSLRRLYTTYPSGDNFYYRDVYDTAKKTWVNEYHIYNGVDASMLKDTTIYRKYNTVSKVWENYLKLTYRYDAQKRFLGTFDYFWVNNEWQPNRRYTYTLLPDGQTQEYLNEWWSSSKNLLLNYSRQRYAYNVKGWQLRDSTDGWNVNNSTWEMNTRRIQSYLASGYLDKSVYSKYNLSSSVWDLTAFTRYHYKSNPVSVSSKPSHNLFQIYPNPAENKFILQSNVTAFEVCSINIFDHTGKRVMPTFVKQSDDLGNIEIEFSSYRLPSGIYFVEFHSSGKIGRMPIMIK